MLRPCRAQTASHEGRYCDLEHLLDDERCPALASLAPAAAASLASVCAVQRTGGAEYYRLDDARALAWLAAKAEHAAAALRAGEAGGGGAFAALGDAGVLSYAVGLLGEYLSAPWLARLQEHLGCAAAGPVMEGGSGGGSKPDAGFAPFVEEGNANKKPKLSKVRMLKLCARACVRGVA